MKRGGGRAAAASACLMLLALHGSAAAQQADTAAAICGDLAAISPTHVVDPELLAGPGEASPDGAPPLEVIGEAGGFRSVLCQLLGGIGNEEVGHINRALSGFISPDSGLAFLKDIDFKLKAFEPQDGQGQSGLGISYDYAKVNSLGDYSDDRTTGVTSGWAWQYRAKGNLAFDSDVNPADFLDTRVSLSGFRNKWLARATMLSFAELNRLEDELAAVEDEQQLQALLAQDTADTIVSAVRRGLPRVRSYIDFELNAGLESDQRFDQKQWTYGAQVALDFKSYDRTAWQTTFNVLDWPFAVVRRLSGYDSRFRVYGSTIPTLVLGIDQVDPKDNAARMALGATGKFDRYRAEVFFRTPIARLGGQEVFFNMDYRYLKERDPLPSVAQAGIDEFKYTVISIASSSGLFVSYRDGMLPFDLEGEQVYEVGWKFDLGSL